jgi:hypothetical protein
MIHACSVNSGEAQQQPNEDRRNCSANIHDKLCELNISIRDYLKDPIAQVERQDNGTL